MPELPEVETVRQGLERHVVGRTVASVQVLHPRAVRRHDGGPAGFESAMAGRPLQAAERRGKYLWLTLDDDEAMLAHLGMSGQMLVGDPERPLSSHVRARFTFADGGPDLRFTDQRTFGYLLLAPLAKGTAASPGGRPPVPPGCAPDTQNPIGRAVSRAESVAGAGAGHAESVAGVAIGRVGAGAGAAIGRAGAGAGGGAAVGCAESVAGAVVGRAGAGAGDRRAVPLPIVHIAADPLEAAFDADAFALRLGRKHTEIKRALLDQSLISGVGNIYADEALWRARLHWARPTETLRKAEVSRLLASVTDVLTEALKAGGTSFDALYINVNGESGYFDRSLNAYGRAGEPCGRCATPIKRDAFMNRSSYSCPRCQPRPRGAARAVGTARAVGAKL